MDVLSKELLTKRELLFIRGTVKREEFFSYITQNYKFLRCYHGSRPLDPSSYYLKGFSPNDFKKSLAEFNLLLKRIEYNEIPNLDWIVKQFSGSRDRLIYMVLNKEDFFNHHPHYWIYGSEFTLYLAQNTSPEIKDHLKLNGIPTIFSIDIPINKFMPHILEGLYDRICIAKGKHLQMLDQIFSNHTVTISDGLSGKYIVDHEHPTREVYDFHSQRHYKNTTNSCAVCKH